MEMANRYPTMCVTVQASDLAAFGAAIVQDAMTKQRAACEEQAREAAGEKLLKADEAGRMLGVSERTLARWRKRGYLEAANLGGQIRYRLSDCRRIIEGGRPQE